MTWRKAWWRSDYHKIHVGRLTNSKYGRDGRNAIFRLCKKPLDNACRLLMLCKLLISKGPKMHFPKIWDHSLVRNTLFGFDLNLFSRWSKGNSSISGNGCKYALPLSHIFWFCPIKRQQHWHCHSKPVLAIDSIFYQ